MTKIKKMSAALLLATLMLVPAMVSAQETPTPGMPGPATEPSVYIQGYLGGGASSVSNGSETIAFTGEYFTYFYGGVKLGYWFTRYGTFAADYPEWMKYFGVYTDVSYQTLNHPNNIVTTYGTPLTTGSSFGYLWTWNFMLAARYGFMPDREVPFGRLQPYIAVGPGLFFSGQDFNIGGFTAGNKTSTDLGLVAETGLRYHIANNVSFEASFKYRYFAPSYSFSPYGTNIRPNTSLFSGQMGLAYHF